MTTQSPNPLPSLGTPEDESPTLFFSPLAAHPGRQTREDDQALEDLALLERCGCVALHSGDLDSAELHFGRAFELCRRSDSKASANLPQAFGHLGILAVYRGDLNRAETMFELGLEVARTVRTALTVRDAMLLQNLGLVARRQGRLDEAERCHTSALSIKVRELGWSHPCVANTLSSQGFLLVQQRRSSEALARFEQARQIHEHVGGAQSLEVAHVNLGTGSAHLQLRDPNAAEPCFVAALAIYESVPLRPIQLARARYLLACARWHRDPRSARALVETAFETYLHSPSPQFRHLRRMRAWLDGHIAQAA